MVDPSSRLAGRQLPPTTYDRLRELLDARLSLYQLRASVRTAYTLARAGEVANPAVPLLIATILESLASRIEGQPLDDETAEMLEAHLSPALRLLLDSVQRPADPAILLDRMNAAVRAYARYVSALD